MSVKIEELRAKVETYRRNLDLKHLLECFGWFTLFSSVEDAFQTQEILNKAEQDVSGGIIQLLDILSNPRKLINFIIRTSSVGQIH